MPAKPSRILIIGDSPSSRASVRAVLDHAPAQFVVGESTGEAVLAGESDLVVAVAPLAGGISLPTAVPVIALGETAVRRPAVQLTLTPTHMSQLPWLARALIAERALEEERAARRAAESEIERGREPIDPTVVALAKSRWVWQERTRRELAETMREVGGALSASLDRTQVLNLILIQLARVLRYDSASILLIEEESLVNVARRTRHDTAGKSRRMPLARYPHLRQAVTERQPVLITDTRHDSRWQTVPGTETIRCWLGVPLLVEGEVIGLLNLTHSKPDFYDHAAAEITLLFANQAAVAIRNARLFAQTEARVRALNLLNHIISAAANQMDTAETLQTGCEALLQYFGSGLSGATRAVAALLDNQGERQRVAAFAGDFDGHIYRDMVIDPDQWPGVASVLTSGRLLSGPKVKEGETLVAWLVVPILVRDRVVGTLRLEFDQPQRVDEEGIRLLQTVGEELGRGLETGRLYSYLRQHAADLENRVLERTRELATANSRLTELDRLKSRFIADMSHELRTPVSNMHLYLDLLGRGNPEKRSHYEGVLRSQANRLEQLLASIFDLLRMESNPAEMKFQGIALNSLAAEIVAEQEERARVVGLNLIFEPALANPIVCGERNYLRRLLTNLLTNAIQFTPSGWVRVCVEAVMGGSWLSVADSGPGIAAEDHPHLFDRFYRGKQAAQMNIPGMGLGLSIAQEITERHGGHIEVLSEEGVGTTFRVWLPAAE